MLIILWQESITECVIFLVAGTYRYIKSPPKDIRESLKVTLTIFEVSEGGGMDMMAGMFGACGCGQSFTIPGTWPMPTTPTTFIGSTLPKKKKRIFINFHL